MVTELKVLQVQGHPTHGDFGVEVPTDYTNEQAREYINSVDLDLMLGIPGVDQSVKGTDVEALKTWENSLESGKRNDKWFPHPSLEGGTDTIGYGHKLTPQEAETGMIQLGDRKVNYRNGLSQEDVDAILEKDVAWAKKVAMSSLNKVGLAQEEGKVEALTSLIYNVGSGSWGKSKAKRFLEAGNMEDFLHEAFSEEAGFVNINGEKSKGLTRRRAEEMALFTGDSQEDTVEGG